MRFTCNIHIIICFNTCCLHVSYMLFTCLGIHFNLHVKYICEKYELIYMLFTFHLHVGYAHVGYAHVGYMLFACRYM